MTENTIEILNIRHRIIGRVICGLNVILFMPGSFFPAQGGEFSMPDALVNIIRNSHDVVYATVRASGRAEIGQVEFLREETTVDHVFKGHLPVNSLLIVDIPMAGKETPNLEVDSGYVFFLKPSAEAESAHTEGRRTIELTRPLSIPKLNRDEYFEYLREAAEISYAPGRDDVLKLFLFKELSSRVYFFRVDACRLAMQVKQWSAPDLGNLVTVLNSETVDSSVVGNERDILVSIVAGHGTPQVVVPLARSELKRGNSDAVYFGFSERDASTLDPILWNLLDGSDKTILLGALRVVGLLRRSDILDAYEEKLPSDSNGSIRAALMEARRLSLRD